MSESERSKNGLSGSPYAGWLTALGLSVFIAAVASSTPFLSGVSRDIIMHLFSGVCHQLPGRSPQVDGIQLAVCHRCIGMYWGIPLAAVVYRLLRGSWPFGRKASVLLLLSAFPAGLDWFGDIVGWWENTPYSRVITGGIFGVVAGYIFVRAVGDIIRNARRRRSSPNTKSV